MKHEKQPKNPNMTFSFNGKEYEANPKNTELYLHTNPLHRIFDHVFIQVSEDEATRKGVPMFRANFGNFDALTEKMTDRGYPVIEKDEVSPNDRDLYVQIFGEPKIELPSFDLTPRQERFCTYFAYILETEQLSPIDFNGEGELKI